MALCLARVELGVTRPVALGARSGARAIGFCATVASVRPLAPLQIVAVISVLGSVLAVMVPTFVRNVHASRLSEPVEGLNRLAARATALAAGRPTELAYPLSVALTPSRVPAGQRELDRPGTWDQPTWQMLDFRFTEPHAFAFSFDSQNGLERSSFVARAHGDLDGDGNLSTFSLGGSLERGRAPLIGHLEVTREVE